MSTAIKYFMSKNSDLMKVTMRFSISGHSAVEEIDHAHSEIEKVLRKNEFFSPLGLLRVLKNINRKKQYELIQLSAKDMFDFGEIAKNFNFKIVPFTQLKMLCFEKNIYTVKFSLDYNEQNFKEVNLRSEIATRKKQSFTENFHPKQIIHHSGIKEHKQTHLKAMFKFMGEQDQIFYRTIFNIPGILETGKNQPGLQNDQLVKSIPITKQTARTSKKTKAKITTNPKIKGSGMLNKIN